MPHDPHRQLAIAERRQNVARRYLRGETQVAIGRALEVDHGTISRDLAAIRAEWLASSLRDFDAARAQELARIDEVERAAWIGWTKSQESAETLEAVVDGDRRRSRKTSKGQAGDPRFLKVVIDCVNRRCAILGLDAEKRLKVTGLIEYANLSDEELDRRIALAQGRAADPAGGAGAPPGTPGDLAPPTRPPDGSA